MTPQLLQEVEQIATEKYIYQMIGRFIQQQNVGLVEGDLCKGYSTFLTT